MITNKKGHQPTRLKHPHVQSLHTTSPLQSPTSAATAANNRSANHTNNNVIVDDNEIANSRISLKSPEFINFNDVYSNCYDSLRNLRNVTDNNIDTDGNKNKTKSDLTIASRPLVSANSKSSESIKSSSQKIKSTSNKKQVPVERYTWYRSASCKDLYHEENNVQVTEKKNEKNLRQKETTYEKDNNFQIGFDSPITRYDDTRQLVILLLSAKPLQSIKLAMLLQILKYIRVVTLGRPVVCQLNLQKVNQAKE